MENCVQGLLGADLEEGGLWGPWHKLVRVGPFSTTLIPW